MSPATFHARRVRLALGNWTDTVMQAGMIVVIAMLAAYSHEYILSSWEGLMGTAFIIIGFWFLFTVYLRWLTLREIRSNDTYHKFDTDSGTFLD